VIDCFVEGRFLPIGKGGVTEVEFGRKEGKRIERLRKKLSKSSGMVGGFGWVDSKL
jgi:hypothetical protein